MDFCLIKKKKKSFFFSNASFLVRIQDSIVLRYDSKQNRSGRINYLEASPVHIKKGLPITSQFTTNRWDGKNERIGGWRVLVGFKIKMT